MQLDSDMRQQRGFTLIEVVLALAILTMTSMAVMGLRTEAVKDSEHCRMWLVAREKAQQILSQLAAGHREIPPESGREERFDGDQFQYWHYVIVRGEDQISDMETRAEEGAESDGADKARRRREWQRQRDDLRGARAAGVSYLEYTDQEYRQEQGLSEDGEEEMTPPSDDELIDIAVFVFFPNIDADKEGEPEKSYFMLKARVSTMAWEGLTPDQAEDRAKAMGIGSTQANPTGGLPAGGNMGQGAGR